MAVRTSAACAAYPRFALSARTHAVRAPRRRSVCRGGGEAWAWPIRERGFVLKEGPTYPLWYTGYRQTEAGIRAHAYLHRAHAFCERAVAFCERYDGFFRREVAFFDREVTFFQREVAFSNREVGLLQREVDFCNR